MQPVNIEFKKIYEHDIDLLILEEFIADRGFAKLFLDKVGLDNNYIVDKAIHSFTDSDGESDITLVLQYPNQKIALLIEDKIDAQTMKEQSQRYHKRASFAIKRGEYDSYYVMLVAPEDYHKEHRNDINADYEYRICYEELRDYFNSEGNLRAAFKAAIMDFAIKEKKTGYQVHEVKAVTEFWIRLRELCKEQYPNLIMLGEDVPKGAAASWPEFRTSLGTIKVIYKTPKGFVDLEFPKYGERIADLLLIVKNKMTDSMQIWKTGKSASIRIANERWKLDFSQNFDKNKYVIDEVLQAVSTLCELASKLNYSELY